MKSIIVYLVLIVGVIAALAIRVCQLDSELQRRESCPWITEWYDSAGNQGIIVNERMYRFVGVITNK